MTTSLTDLCPKLVILHLMYAVRPMDTLTLGELSISGSSSPRMVAEGRRKDEGDSVDPPEGRKSEGANPESGKKECSAMVDRMREKRRDGATNCERVRSAHKSPEIISAHPLHSAALSLPPTGLDLS